MTLWIIAAVVVIAGFALAWVTSGRAKPDSRTHDHDPRLDEARAASQRHQHDLNGPGGF